MWRPECGVCLDQVSVRKHLLMQHGRINRLGREGKVTVDREIMEEEVEANDTVEAHWECRVAFLRGVAHVQLPVEGCPRTGRPHTKLLAHFARQHPGSISIILEVGSLPYPHFTSLQYDCTVPSSVDHTSTNAHVQGGAILSQQDLALEISWRAEGVELTVQGGLLEKVDSFRYCGRLLIASDSGWSAVQAYLQKSRKNWARIARVLIRKGVILWTSGNFYKFVVQSVLLYGSEMWAVTGRNLGALDWMHQKVERGIAKRRATFDRAMEE